MVCHSQEPKRTHHPVHWSKHGPKHGPKSIDIPKLLNLEPPFGAWPPGPIHTRSDRKPRRKGSFDVKEWIPSRWHVTSNMKVEGTNTWALTLCLGKDTEPKTGCGGFESRKPISELGASKTSVDQTCVDIPRQTLKGKLILCMH